MPPPCPYPHAAPPPAEPVTELAEVVEAELVEAPVAEPVEAGPVETPVAELVEAELVEAGLPGCLSDGSPDSLNRINPHPAL